MSLLSQLERAYYVKKLGGTQPAVKDLDQIKRDYYISFLDGTNPTMKLSQLEELWMIKTITDAGGTPSGLKSDLWKQMVLSISKTPTNLTSENMRIFYLNAS